MHNRIAVVGSLNIDLVVQLDRMPAAGETVFGTTLERHPGGKGLNQAVAAARLESEVHMIGAVGDDGSGDWLRDVVRREGIHSDGIATATGTSGTALIEVDNSGQNRIIVIPGANDGLLPEHATAAVAAMDRVDVVIGQFEIRQTVTTAAFTAAHERGAVSVLNPAPAAAVSDELAAVTDWLIPNEHEFAIIAAAAGLSDDVEDPAALVAFAEGLGVRLLVTLGERGAVIVGRDGKIRRVETPTVDAVDTTGAGDAFVGAFAFGLASGRSEDSAARLGCAIAAESVLRPGTQKSFPDHARCRAIIAGVEE